MMPFYISRPDGLPLTFAGLWERWGPDSLLSCTILTADAADAIRTLHDRMPVMLDAGGIEGWLSGCDPVVSDGIGDAVQFVPVSPRMNSPRCNEPDCIVPLAG